MRENNFSDDMPNSEPMRPKSKRRTPKTGPMSMPSGRLTEDERVRLADLLEDTASYSDRPKHGDRWSTWDRAVHGPEPRPDWVITELAAEDTELGVLKTGKEADVFLLRRGIGVDGPSCVVAAKRYRTGEHKLFHRDSQYLEGRRLRKSRENRAIEGRTSFGRNLIAEQWAVAEFAALSRLWTAGVPVPYPVQLQGTELLMEFVDSADETDEGAAAPRLAQLRPEPDELRHLWEELLAVLITVAREGLTHGDLSAYNILVRGGMPVLIDLPQVVDLTINPAGPEFLVRDVRNITGWFAARGLPAEVVDQDEVSAMLLAEAGLA